MMTIEDIRHHLKKSNLDAYLITRNNAYLNEDLLDEENLVRHLTSFTGSNATLLILNDKIHLFTDGRYEIQAKQQVDTSQIEIVTKPMNRNWLNTNLTPNTKIGYNPWCHSVKKIEGLTNEHCQFKFIEDENFGNIISNKEVVIFDHNTEFSGIEAEEKISLVTKKIQTMKADAYFISAADSVSWLLNQRSNLLPTTPLYRAMAIVNKDGEVKVFNHLDEIEKEIAKYKKGTINFCMYQTPQKIRILLEKHKVNYESFIDPCQEMKAIKNPVEIQGLIKSHVRDGVSMVKFLYWLENNWQNKTEYELSQKLYDYRKINENFFSSSFDTIMAYNANAALAHYRPEKDQSSSLNKDGILLIDSGAQYLDGTTDITRTLPLGNINDEIRDYYTIVLKSHIALASTVFPKETPGIKLDIIARKELWKYGKDYNHGTGHGVGCFLNVHEGPLSISTRGTQYGLKENMITSIEPGYYVENNYGIRIENLYKIAQMNEDFLYFEPLTLCPINKQLINKSMLNADEILWLNNYHKLVYTTLESFLEEHKQTWLQNACSLL